MTTERYFATATAEQLRDAATACRQVVALGAAEDDWDAPEAAAARAKTAELGWTWDFTDWSEAACVLEREAMLADPEPVQSGPTARFHVTWVERGTNNAACIGLDEVVDAEGWTEDELREVSEDSALQQGVDLDRYECAIELVYYPDEDDDGDMQRLED